MSTIEFSNTIRIEREPAAVFAYLTAFENLPEWNYAIESTRRIDHGPVGRGARYVQTRSIPRRAEERFEVIDYEPDRGVTIRGQFGPLFGTMGYDLAPAGMGDATLLTNTASLDGSRGLGLLAPLAGRQVKSAVAANLTALRERLERGR